MVAATVAALALGGCSLPDGGAPAPASALPADGVVTVTPTPEPPAAGPSAATGRPVTRTVTADGIEVLVSVPPTDAGAPVTVTPDEDGTSRLVLVLAAPQDVSARSGSAPGPTTGTGSPAASALPATLDLVSPADGSLVRNSDGSLTVLDAAGTPLGGFSAPEATQVSGPAGRAAVVVVAPTRAEVHVQAEGATPSGTPDGAAPDDGAMPQSVTVTTWLGAQGVRSATWGEREGGRSLAVDPTPWARQSGIVGEATVWAQLVASEPEAASRTMRDQLDCHTLGANDKTTWNLEPWRPDVGFLATAAARCNPT